MEYIRVVIVVLISCLLPALVSGVNSTPMEILRVFCVIFIPYAFFGAIYSMAIRKTMKHGYFLTLAGGTIGIVVGAFSAVIVDDWQRSYDFVEFGVVGALIGSVNGYFLWAFSENDNPSHRVTSSGLILGNAFILYFVNLL